MTLLTKNPLRDSKKILITGGAGFIGSHLSRTLLEKGHSVTVMDDLSTGDFENIRPFKAYPNFSFCIDTILNDSVLDRLVSEADYVFHLAAVVGVRLIVEQPVHTLKTNILGTEAVLNAAMRYRAKVIMTSTSEVYGKGIQIPFREEDDVVIGPTSKCRWAYAATKMVDEFLALAYHSEMQLQAVICRLFNTVGPGQSSNYGMVLPRFMQQALQNKKLTVFGDGSQSRCFMHVNDAVKALVALADHPEAEGQVYNIGSNNSITMLDLARKVLTLVHPGQDPDEMISLIPFDEAYPGGRFEDMMVREPCTDKLQKATGWKIEWDLDAIIQDVYEYCSDNAR